MLSTKIKEATKIAHQQLEKVVVQRLKTIANEEDYAELLGYFYAYFGKLEKAMAPFVTKEILPDYKIRRKSAALEKDIQELCFGDKQLPDVTIPEIGNTLEAFGALYVMEGSVMGGSIIVEMLKKKGIEKGISFFSGYGENTIGMWGTFTSVLNNLAATEKEEQIVIRSADATFAHFAMAFEAVKAG